MPERIKSLFVFDRKNIIRISIALVLSVVEFILVARDFPEACAGIVMFFVLAVPSFKVSGKHRFILDIIYPLYAAFFGIYYFQLANLIGHPILEELFSYWGFLLVQNRVFYELSFIICAYFICRMFFMSPKVAAIVCEVPFMLIATIDYYVYQFRGHELVAYDFLSIQTAGNVVGEYTFDFYIPIVYMVLPLVLYSLMFVHTKVEKSVVKAYLRFPLFLVLSAVFAFASYASVSAWYTFHEFKEWGDIPSYRDGYFLNFFKSFEVMTVKAPEGYSAEALNEAISETDIGDMSVEAAEDSPNIIVIMNESYADLSIYSDITGETENPDPYWDTLKNEDNVISGYAYSSVYGGNTCNSEYEFLTGMSMAYMPQSSVPYNSYIADEKSYSIAHFLKSAGYSTLVMHPYFSSGWNRTTVYPLLGFDDMMFVDEFEYGEEDIISGKISDMCAYRNLITLLENKSSSEKDFIFMITIQNHSPYDEPDFEPTQYCTTMSDYNNLLFNTFNTLISHSDSALEYLIDYLEGADEKYVLCIFGDHQPDSKLTSTDDFNPGGRGWLVPYIIWANYDFEVDDEYVHDYTSLNYLGLDCLSVAGFEYNAYYNVLADIRKEVPFINAVGYYSLKTASAYDNGYYGDETDEELLSFYGMLEYNLVFDENKAEFMSDFYGQS